MDVHVKFLLAFVLALKRVAKATEVFAFNTSLTRLTPWLSPGKIGRTIERLAADVPGWSGGTRIGESLMEFVDDVSAAARHAPVGRRDSQRRPGSRRHDDGGRRDAGAPLEGAQDRLVESAVG